MKSIVLWFETPLLCRQPNFSEKHTHPPFSRSLLSQARLSLSLVSVGFVLGLLFRPKDSLNVRSVVTDWRSRRTQLRGDKSIISQKQPISGSRLLSLSPYAPLSLFMAPILPHICTTFFHTCPNLPPWRRKQYFPPKQWRISSRLYDVTFQKTTFYTVIGATNWKLEEVVESSLGFCALAYLVSRGLPFDAWAGAYEDEGVQEMWLDAGRREGRVICLQEHHTYNVISYVTLALQLKQQQIMMSQEMYAICNIYFIYLFTFWLDNDWFRGPVYTGC
jgi:hypothetical protein